MNGTHTVFLTGSYLAADDNYESDDGEGDLTEDDLESYLGPDDDGLDDLGTPRIAEIGSDEDAPQLLQLKAGKPTNKGKNKRPANFDDEDAGTLDNIITKALAPEAPDGQKLSKKQLKKLKKNDGQAGAAAQEAKEAPKTSDKNGSKDSSTKKENGSKDSTKDSGADKKDKKVQFAKNLEQGPTGSPKPLGTQNVQGVAVDDKKVGKGPAAKKGDKVEMRYIGKLADGKVFDCELPIACPCTAYRCQPTRRASPSASSSAPARSSRAGTLASRASQLVESDASPSRPSLPTATKLSPAFPPTRAWCSTSSALLSTNSVCMLAISSLLECSLV